MWTQNHLKKNPFKLNKGYLICLIIIINILSITASAQPKNPAQTIYFESDTLSYNSETKLGIYQGHIKLIQGSGVLTADYATSYSDQKGQITKVIAMGSPARYQALIFPNQPKLIATGNTIYYYPQKDWLEAVGNAEIVQGQNHLKGPQINYDFKKKTVGSPISKIGHTQILIAPMQTVTHE
ncbi:MAG: component of the Lpt lipopolysaccharide transport system [Pseudomonadota bacterium]|jgi:lipopolysaccharide export system protein LptA